MVDIMNWRKSSYSGSNSGNCVEVADHDNRVLVRDAKNRAGTVLRFTPDAWRRFADRVKRSLASAPGHVFRGTFASGARGCPLPCPASDTVATVAGSWLRALIRHTATTITVMHSRSSI
jgi:Domain of unknown function (DUF397)